MLFALVTEKKKRTGSQKSAAIPLTPLMDSCPFYW